MTVSIVMITYNHEKYIREAVEGVLMQKCKFDYELIISNDASTDNTDSVVQEIIQTHPNKDKIKYFYHEKNLGMQPNFIFAYKQCSGKYIALCEGDDYWTDEYKLHKQVRFLEKNSDVVLCSGNAYKIIEGNDYRKEKYCHWNQNRYFNQEEIIVEFYAPNLNNMFRKVIKEFPDFFYQALSGDVTLYLLLSSYGKFYFFNDIFGIYRIHEKGISQVNTIDFYKKLAWLKNTLFICEKLKNTLPKKALERKKAKLKISMCYTALFEQYYFESVKLYFNLFFYQNIYAFEIKEFWIFPLVYIKKRIGF